MATFWSILLVALLVVFVVVFAALLYRFVTIRGHATPVLVRPSSEQWRYGALRFSPGEALFYWLVSIRPGADLLLQRRTITLGERRQPTEDEIDLVEHDEIIISLSGKDRHDHPVSLEICLDSRSLTALLSWVEACSTDDVRLRSPRPRRDQ